MTANHEITAIGLLALFLIFALGVCLFRAAFCSDWKPFIRAIRARSAARRLRKLASDDWHAWAKKYDWEPFNRAWWQAREARRHELRRLQLQRDIRRGYKVADEARAARNPHTTAARNALGRAS